MIVALLYCDKKKFYIVASLKTIQTHSTYCTYIQYIQTYFTCTHKYMHTYRHTVHTYILYIQTRDATMYHLSYCFKKNVIIFLKSNVYQCLNFILLYWGTSDTIYWYVYTLYGCNSITHTVNACIQTHSTLLWSQKQKKDIKHLLKTW